MRARKVDHAAVVADVRSGMTYEEVGKKYGISTSTASRIGRKGGVHRYSGESSTWQEDEWYDNFCTEWDRVRLYILGRMQCKD